MRTHLARHAGPISLAAGGLFAAAVGYLLWTHQVPVALLVCCTSAVLGMTCVLTDRLLSAAGAVTHRCGVTGCTFTVRLTGVTATESRMWQETVADHPSHRPLALRA